MELSQETLIVMLQPNWLKNLCPGTEGKMINKPPAPCGRGVNRYGLGMPNSAGDFLAMPSS